MAPRVPGARILTATLLVVLAAVQNPLWFGKGGWLRVWELDRQIAQQRAQNDQSAQRNAALEAEVRDLGRGLDAVEERARVDLGMIRPQEVFYRYIPSPGPISRSAP